MKLDNLDDSILNNLALWLGVKSQDVKKIGEIFLERPNSYYEGILDSQGCSRTEWLVRRLTHKIIKFIKERNRYNILDTIKKIRQLQRKDLIEISQCRFTALDAQLRKDLNIPPIDWRGKKAVICLSHDIDSVNDYKISRKVFELNRKYGLKSTFNFLTHWGYEIDREFLKELDKDGFEIGLHGYTHDIAIGIRPEERIKRELGWALEKINWPVKGYRAPAFAVTKRLLKALKELGIKYDSSMKTVSCYGQAVETFYPYRFPGVGIWEIPLTIQDDRVFRDLNLSNEEGLGVIKELAQRVIDVGGVAVINNHPKLISDKMYYYEELLKWIAGLDNVWVATTGEVIDFMEEREKNIASMT
ncbi:MAG: polysaccharide deacetylase family protein [bacterium]